MRFLLFSGSHERHVYVHEQIINSDIIEIGGIVSMNRESTLPDPPEGWPDHDKELFEHHFQLRHKVEKRVYGDRSIKTYDPIAPSINIDPNELNTDNVAKFVEKIDPDACFIFGTGLILDPVLSVLPEWRLNFHLGLSPRYKGSATLFWPFYFLEPQYAGGTLHQITKNPDAGKIVHQTTPKLESGDGIHEVAAKTVVQFADETVTLLEYLAKNNSLPLTTQTNTGKLFLSKDFDPHHLRVIYDLYDNDIVDEYIKGNIGNNEPELVNCFDKLEINHK